MSGLIICVMGVAGAGKTTLGQRLASELHCEFLDADTLHPAVNIEKMSRGVALIDADRTPWLAAVHARVVDSLQRRQTLVVACSALKQKYRDTIGYGVTMSAPVTVIIAYDLKFYEKLPKLFPHNPSMRDVFANNPQLIEETAKRNSSLQGAYFMLAARALGLDCGPMSGFDNAEVDEEFFAAGKCEPCGQEFFPAGHVKSNFLCSLGYGDSSKLSPRSPRLDFSEACTLM